MAEPSPSRSPVPLIVGLVGLVLMVAVVVLARGSGSSDGGGGSGEVVAEGGAEAFGTAIEVDSSTTAPTDGTTPEDDDPDATAPPQDPIEDSGIMLTPPPGWFAADDALVVAEVEEDLTDESPRRARVTVILAGPDHDPAAEFEAAAASGLTVAEERKDGLSVSGQPAESIALFESVDGNDYVRGYVLVSPPGGDAILLRLEAPAKQWNDIKATLVRAVTIG